jgi:hypothetical protein
MWAKNEFDTNSIRKDFSFLLDALNNVNPDISYYLAHILGKCLDNDRYCASAKGELIRLAKIYVPIRISLKAICFDNSKMKNIFLNIKSDIPKQTIDEDSTKIVAKL